MSKKKAERRSSSEKPADGGAETRSSEQTATPRPHPGVASLSSRHKKTLKAIFERPTRADIRWSDIEGLIVALGGRVDAGRGSRRRAFLVRPAVFHEPHPEPETSKGGVESVRSFLKDAGVEPS